MCKHVWSRWLPALGILVLWGGLPALAGAETPEPPPEESPPAPEPTPDPGATADPAPDPAADPEAEAKAVEAFNLAKQLYQDGKFVEWDDSEYASGKRKLPGQK